MIQSYSGELSDCDQQEDSEEYEENITTVIQSKKFLLHKELKNIFGIL